MNVFVILALALLIWIALSYPVGLLATRLIGRGSRSSLGDHGL